MLRWTFDGPVLSADEAGRCYSGSLAAQAVGLEAFLTIDNPGHKPRQHQVRTVSWDAGATWRRQQEPVGPSGENVRDPFVWTDGGGSGGCW
jgi:sucrose-6-phosphate hydrolase SacC (GH32 family)